MSGKMSCVPRAGCKAGIDLLALGYASSGDATAAILCPLGATPTWGAPAAPSSAVPAEEVTQCLNTLGIGYNAPATMVRASRRRDSTGDRGRRGIGRRRQQNGRVERAVAGGSGPAVLDRPRRRVAPRAD